MRKSISDIILTEIQFGSINKVRNTPRAEHPHETEWSIKARQLTCTGSSRLSRGHEFRYALKRRRQHLRLSTVQVKGEAHAVGPAQPCPPHWLYCCATAPVPVADADALEAEALDADVGTCEAVVVDPPLGGGATPVAPPPGTAVGTVEGWSAVFQVAVVGQGVAATAGEGSLYGAGPGT